MTEKEVKNKILCVLYDMQKNSETDISASLEGLLDVIPDSNINQITRVCKALADSGYFKLAVSKDGGVIHNVSSSAYSYVESHLLDNKIRMGGINNKNKPSKENKLTSNGSFSSAIGDDLDLNGQIEVDTKNGDDIPQRSSEVSESTAVDYLPIKTDINIVDSAIDPCFGVAGTALSLLEVLDSVNMRTAANVSMIGIFAPWGRGKTYFLKQLKKIINIRDKNIKNKIKDNAIEYDIVEFNAWKYQETPALWAYLYEELISYKSRLFRWALSSWRIFIVALSLISVVLASVFKFVPAIWVAGAASVLSVLNVFFGDFQSAYSIIKKYCGNISFHEQLGIQAEVEKEISRLFKRWIKKKDTNNHKILLLVDDIDRCDESKMIGIIESLRTVLENEEIRKRLSIIISVDANKLKLGFKHKYSKTYTDLKPEEIESIVREQMDKLFVFGLALPEISYEDDAEYISKLVGENIDTDDKFSRPLIESVGFDEYIEYNSPKNINSKHGYMLSSEKIVGEMLYASIKNYSLSNKLSPRQIRIIYYRCLFAINLLSDRKVSFDEQLIELIIKESYNIIEIPSFYSPYDRVIKMVVAY